MPPVRLWLLPVRNCNRTRFDSIRNRPLRRSGLLFFFVTVRWIFNNDESIVFCCVSWCYKVGIIVYKTFFGKSTGLFRRTLYFPIFSMWKTDRSAMGYGKGKVAAPCYFCCCRYFLTPPSLRATSPLFCITKHPVMLRDTAGEEVKSVQGREKGKEYTQSTEGVKTEEVKYSSTFPCTSFRFYRAVKMPVYNFTFFILPLLSLCIRSTAVTTYTYWRGPCL